MTILGLLILVFDVIWQKQLLSAMCDVGLFCGLIHSALEDHFDVVKFELQWIWSLSVTCVLNYSSSSFHNFYNTSWWQCMTKFGMTCTSHKSNTMGKLFIKNFLKVSMKDGSGHYSGLSLKDKQNSLPGRTLSIMHSA